MTETDSVAEGIQITQSGYRIPVSLLRVKDGFNPRENAHPDKELLESIKQNGIQRPLHVRENPDEPGTFLIVDGERRFNAAIEAQLETAPIVFEGAQDDDTALVLALVANNGHAPLTAAETANAFKRLSAAGIEEEQIAQLMGFDMRKVREISAVLESGTESLIESIKTEVKEEKIPARAAARVAKLPKKSQEEIIPKIKGKDTVEATAIVRDLEKKMDIRPKRGRKAAEFVIVKDARKVCDLLFQIATLELNTAKAASEQKRAQAFLDVCELLRGKTTIAKLMPNAYQAYYDQHKVKETEKKMVANRKATKATKAVKKAAKKSPKLVKEAKAAPVKKRGPGRPRKDAA